MPIPELPVDILNTIIDEYHSDRPTLKTLALVSRAWVPQSRSHLFYEISLFQNGVAPFLELLGSPQSTIPQANTRELVVSTNIYFEGQEEDDMMQTSPALNILLTWRSSDDLSLVDIFPNLKKMSLNWIGWDTLSDTAKETLHEGFQSLEQLSLWNTTMGSADELTTLLKSFPMLQLLHVDGGFISSRSSRPPSESDLISNVHTIKLMNLSSEHALLVETLQSCRSLRDLWCHFMNYSDADAPTTKAIGELIAAAGSSLEEFTVEVQASGILRDGYDLDESLSHIDLSKAPMLKHLNLKYREVDVTPLLERIAKSNLPPSLEILDVEDLPLDWLKLDDLLQHKVFSKVSQVRYTVVSGYADNDVIGRTGDDLFEPNRDSPAFLNMEDNVEKSMQRLPKCKERGILHPKRFYHWTNRFSW